MALVDICSIFDNSNWVTVGLFRIIFMGTSINNFRTRIARIYRIYYLNLHAGMITNKTFSLSRMQRANHEVFALC